jgi:hypothetical protein
LVFKFFKEKLILAEPNHPRCCSIEKQEQHHFEEIIMVASPGGANSTNLTNPLKFRINLAEQNERSTHLELLYP